jgi:gamma-glutamyltranspeptidase / glutathione hydrolase
MDERCLGTGRVLLEEGFEDDRASQLEARGHRVSVAEKSQQGIFGRGQIIMRDPETGVLWGGSDPRADGQALAW